MDANHLLETAFSSLFEWKECADVIRVVSCDLVLSSCEILPSGHSVVSKK